MILLMMSGRIYPKSEEIVGGKTPDTREKVQLLLFCQSSKKDTHCEIAARFDSADMTNNGMVLKKQTTTRRASPENSRRKRAWSESDKFLQMMSFGLGAKVMTVPLGDLLYVSLATI